MILKNIRCYSAVSNLIFSYFHVRNFVFKVFIKKYQFNKQIKKNYI